MTREFVVIFAILDFCEKEANGCRKELYVIGFFHEARYTPS
jgi:hypothetical protein